MILRVSLPVIFFDNSKSQCVFRFQPVLLFIVKISIDLLCSLCQKALAQHSTVAEVASRTFKSPSKNNRPEASIIFPCTSDRSAIVPSPFFKRQFPTKPNEATFGSRQKGPRFGERKSHQQRKEICFHFIEPFHESLGLLRGCQIFKHKKAPRHVKAL